MARGRIREKDKAAALGRIGTAADYGAFADCDIVIEAGWFGQSGRGFYDYSGDKPVPTR